MPGEAAARNEKAEGEPNEEDASARMRRVGVLFFAPWGSGLMAFPSVEIIARKAGAVWGELPRRAWDEKTGESQDLARAGASIVATRPGFLFANSLESSVRNRSP